MKETALENLLSMKINILKVINKLNRGENINSDEVFALLIAPTNELEELGLDTDVLYDMAEWFLKEEPDYTEWSDFDEDYSEDTYLYGIEYKGIRVATGYTGIAGCYWRYDDICPTHWYVY